ncbi:MAG: UDP-N-acetylmuramoyl-L-alanyl-D-glutamate--2,6-diaminopimelate ligase [Oscillospiraceae bacterium]|nr:UDP-N-acetylmuramoyl-L-alanyl-D-glutamate--2,6-diaminopimelate ligase [Oscillospiraceae bacterium]
MEMLHALLEKTGLTYTYDGEDRQISGVTDDSRAVTEGDIFVCIRGERFDGHTAVDEVMKKGAACVVTDHDTGAERQVMVDDTRLFYGRLVAELCGRPDKRLRLIGITGTNGKTTTATLIHSILMANGHKSGFIGTTQVLVGNEPCERDDSTPTTPKVGELYSLFARMADEGCEYCVMEVSSFALCQNRIGPAVFETAVFTNLTQDHLDYHGTMEEYYRAKKLLFTRHCKKALINTDDSYGRRLFGETDCDKLSFGEKDSDVTFRAHGFENGVTVFDYSYDGDMTVALPMIGAYNVSNAAAAVTVCRLAGLSYDEIKTAVETFGGVRGRCEIIPTGMGFTMLCDYAHSPDALENMLSSARENTKGRLICLFGCGGDRDSTKRPLMAAAAARYADMLIITSDNPRNEDPDAIIDDIMRGVPEGTEYVRITDRREAIAYAAETARYGDVVVLAGKGHEDYQILAGGVHIRFDEREIAGEALDRVRETLTDEDIKHFTRADECTAPAFRIAADRVSSDTRTIESGDVFIALKGENFDGADFADKAVESGAAAVITDRRGTGVPSIVVSNTAKALHDIAHGYRMRFDMPLVGITGSVGKTTTKEMIACVLSGKYNTLKTEGNRNNEVGMPFTLLRLKNTHKAAVIEMGMSHFGEIERLSSTCAPNVAVITNIGWSHAENLGSQDGILKAKLEILTGADKDAPLVICGDDRKLRPLKDSITDRQVITCGMGADNDYTAENIDETDSGVSFDIVHGSERARVSLACKGEHHITDALIAAAAGACAGVDTDTAAAALEGFAPGGLRQHTEDINGVTALIDCYNAAPASVKAALGVLAKTKGKRRIAVLADMLELGQTSPELHAETGEYAKSLGIEVLCYGELSKNTASAAGGRHFADKAELIKYLQSYLEKGDAVLFKASRGMKMEEVINSLKGEQL